jgi:8-oxo-dGTP diphosphatase
MAKTTTPASDLSFPRPLCSVDLAIFAAVDGRLHLLLVKRVEGPGEPFPGHWALPGGFVDIARDRDLEATARRKLVEKTGVRSPYLEQLGGWGDARRDPRGWSATHVYFALIAAESVTLSPGANAVDVGWFAVTGDGVKPKLAFDHARILGAAVQRLRGKVEYTSLPVHLLPAEFTLGELQQVYEIVLGRSLDKSAFRTRVLTADVIAPTGHWRGGANRPAQLYRAKDRDIVYFPRPFEPRKRRANKSAR